MTREEAIKIYNTVWLFGKCDCPKEEIDECLELTIKALEQEPFEDAISRQALIERINNAEENFKADNMESIASDIGDPFVDGVLSGIFNIRQMVAQAPPVTPTQKWIPVSERLPEIESLYLVSLVNEFVGFPHISIDGFIMSKQKWERFGSLVSAWMPLPEPYKPEMEG